MGHLTASVPRPCHLLCSCPSYPSSSPNTCTLFLPLLLHLAIPNGGRGMECLDKKNFRSTNHPLYNSPVTPTSPCSLMNPLDISHKVSSPLSHASLMYILTPTAGPERVHSDRTSSMRPSWGCVPYTWQAPRPQSWLCHLLSACEHAAYHLQAGLLMPVLPALPAPQCYYGYQGEGITDETCIGIRAPYKRVLLLICT